MLREAGGAQLSGQRRRARAFDDLIQGAAAIPSLFAAASGGEPRYVPLTMADRTVGISAVGAILAALWHRERTGEGQAVDIPMSAR